MRRCLSVSRVVCVSVCVYMCERVCGHVLSVCVHVCELIGQACVHTCVCEHVCVSVPVCRGTRRKTSRQQEREIWGDSDVTPSIGRASPGACGQGPRSFLEPPTILRVAPAAGQPGPGGQCVLQGGMATAWALRRILMGGRGAVCTWPSQRGKDMSMFEQALGESSTSLSGRQKVSSGGPRQLCCLHLMHL